MSLRTLRRGRERMEGARDGEVWSRDKTSLLYYHLFPAQAMVEAA
jgi:hypothetical protein